MVLLMNDAWRSIGLLEVMRWWRTLLRVVGMMTYVISSHSNTRLLFVALTMRHVEISIKQSIDSYRRLSRFRDATLQKKPSVTATVR
jgi:hypothetical protein